MRGTAIAVTGVLVAFLVGGGMWLVYEQGGNIREEIPNITSTILSTKDSAISKGVPVVILGGLSPSGLLTSAYAVGEERVYYGNWPIGEADPKTFRVLTGALQDMKGYLTYDYAVDKNNVYYQGHPLIGVDDPTNFRPIENGRGSYSYGTDGKYVYFGQSVVAGRALVGIRSFSEVSDPADPNTFVILWEPFWEGCQMSRYSKDSKHVYFESALVPEADPNTFTAEVNGYGRDGMGYYKGIKYIGPTIDSHELDCRVG